jgi:hypothetical protein
MKFIMNANKNKFTGAPATAGTPARVETPAKAGPKATEGTPKR